MTRMPTGATRVAAVIGDPVAHSRSPRILNAAFAALDLDWIYVAFPVPDGAGAGAVEAMRTLGIAGLSVTTPHKDAVAAAVDRRTPAAEVLGACNCVFRQGDELVGDSTDGDGFVRALRAEIGLDLAGRTVGVIGAGGAARSIVDAVGRAGATEVVVVNRTGSRGARAAGIHPVGRVGEPEDLGAAEIVVNATSVGMVGGPAPGALPVASEVLRPDHIVADIVYQPLVTPFMAAAEAIGATVVGGLPMLVHQAAIAFEHWTGHAAPVEVMRDAVELD